LTQPPPGHTLGRPFLARGGGITCHPPGIRGVEITEEACAGAVDRECDKALVAPFSRRHLLAWGATTAVAAGVPGFVASAGAAVRPASWLRRASYAGQLGESFRAGVVGGPVVSLRLETVGDLSGTTPNGRPVADRNDAFVLELRGPETPRLTQGIYELRNRALGRASLFLVPQAPGKNGSTYAVVVNRSSR
jgi:hypothetical protein